MTGLLPATASAAEGGTPTIIQLGDSFSSGEGGGWKGNASTRAGSSQGDREGTDMAARQKTDGSWQYRPEQYVYEESTYRENGGHWGQNPCHRALSAPIQWVQQKSPEITKVVNVACSGAKSVNVWKPENGGVEQYSGLKTQLQQVADRVNSTDDVKLVAIGVGGNDMRVGDETGFGAVVAQCVKAYLFQHNLPGYAGFCKDTFEGEIGESISSVYYNTLKTIDGVRSTLASRGQPVGSYRIVLVGYPSITPTDSSDWSTVNESTQWDKRCPIRRTDSTWVNNHVVTRLNNILRSAATGQSVGFIDMRDAFAGHRLCESNTFRPPSSANQAEWVRYLDIGNVSPEHFAAQNLTTTSGEDLSEDLASHRHFSESFHPNHWGQQAIGDCLSEYWKNTTGNTHRRCFVGGVGPLNNPDNMALGTAPAQSTVTDVPANKHIGNPTVRQVTVPDAVPAGHYFQFSTNITHPRKGQLQIDLVSPNGTTHRLKQYNPGDTGAWGTGGEFIRNYTSDPSGTWTLRIYDQDQTTYNGTLNSWSLRTF
ncbi:proprotein convertase P-domain-containing protein [Streptomyces cinereoruber]|uniref:proprotein convertase P-domain-containing protein n=1 Tax=Streptomyces cinereoruber TaxID=67260 RepID=UPI0036419D25